MHLSLQQREAERAQQCDRRWITGCHNVDIKLGWVSLIDIDDCDHCWKLMSRGQHDQADAFRDSVARKIINTVLDEGIENYKPLVQLTIMRRHMPTMAGALEERIRTTKPKPPKRWFWFYEGRPWWMRLPRAIKIAWRAMWNTLESEPGCGCSRVTKAVVKAIKG